MPGADNSIEKLTEEKSMGVGDLAISCAHLDGLNPEKSHAAKIGVATANWQISGEHLVGIRLQMRWFGPTEELLWLTQLPGELGVHYRRFKLTPGRPSELVVGSCRERARFGLFLPKSENPAHVCCLLNLLG